MFDRIFITGDTHGRFKRIAEFCIKASTTKNDLMVILGDAGFNFWLRNTDKYNKQHVQDLPITILCVHGNHEERPYNISSYITKEWSSGIVYYETQYPDILFAKDGEIYNLNNKNCIVIGGAYSVDKQYRLERDYPWFASEQPDNNIKSYVETQLNSASWSVDYVFSHTVPLKYEPREWFLDFIDQCTVDKSTEEWLDSIEDRLSYTKWYAGHYHGCKTIDKLRLMFEDYVELGQ